MDYKKEITKIVKSLMAKNGVELENALHQQLVEMYDKGYSDGIRYASPWRLVNLQQGTDEIFDSTAIDEEDITIDEFNDTFEYELGSLIENYLDLSDYETFEDFNDAVTNDEISVDPIIFDLFQNMYLYNRYTDEEYYYGRYQDAMEYIEENWERLK